MKPRILILTSRKNFTWVSMEEIITWIEKSWKKWAQKRQIACEIINVDDSNLRQAAQLAISSDFIVVTCFNTSISSFLYGLRHNLSISTPWVFYLHGLASFGCWPLFKWKIGQLLMSNDVFIGSCHRDKKQFDLIFKNVRCEIIPFSYETQKPIPALPVKNRLNLAYIGRITSQKNLHVLIQALSVLQEHTSDWEMHFFGSPDNYGSPLMGRRDSSYQHLLNELSHNAGLSGQIHFHGFKKREDIEIMMGEEQWTFVSPSIHSDENFGMAAFRCLLAGHRVILSNWGGHADYIQTFPQQVALMDVYKSSIGPFISINELAGLLKEEIHKKAPAPDDFPEYYSEERIMSIYSQLHETFKTDKKISPVIVFILLNELLEKREYFLKNSDFTEGSQIFSGYDDPLSEPFFDAYGQKEYSDTKRNGNSVLVPWVSEKEERFEVNDPHRGSFQLPKNKFRRVDLEELGLVFFPE